MKKSDIAAQLEAPFFEGEIVFEVEESTTQKSQEGDLVARCWPKLTPVAIFRRLDDIFGWDRWSCATEVVFAGASPVGYQTTLNVASQGDASVSRSDTCLAGDSTSLSVAKDESVCRAALQLGIGRGLQECSEVWALVDQNGEILEFPQLPMDLCMEPIEMDQAQNDTREGNSEPGIVTNEVLGFEEFDQPQHRTRELPEPQTPPGYQANRA